ncbi:hypothetical protein GY45DRAFT_394969 [Cubamyces sp. BRFM 1775]|nr:hypothetical protein GY45DRAFT_394969 [Cubamyces sp. BRFM 1775]
MSYHLVAHSQPRSQCPSDSILSSYDNWLSFARSSSPLTTLPLPQASGVVRMYEIAKSMRRYKFQVLDKGDGVNGNPGCQDGSSRNSTTSGVSTISSCNPPNSASSRTPLPSSLLTLSNSSTLPISTGSGGSNSPPISSSTSPSYTSSHTLSTACASIPSSCATDGTSTSIAPTAPTTNADTNTTTVTTTTSSPNPSLTRPTKIISSETTSLSVATSLEDTAESPGIAATSHPSSSSNSGTNNNAVGSRGTGRSDTGAIVGGVIGGFALLLLAICIAVLLRRRARARRTAPSAEFMDIMRHGGIGLGTGGSGGALSPVKHDGGSTTPGLDDYYSDAIGENGGLGSARERPIFPYARQSSLESDEPPPAFTPGPYKDPVLEKVQAAAEMRERYFRRESLATMAGAGLGAGMGVGPIGSDRRESESGQGLGHTMNPEKVEYAWAL